MKPSHFWHPPGWKWWVVFILLACFVFLLFWKPSSHVKVELLPFSDSPPTWNGSYLYLTISPIIAGTKNAGTKHVTFKSSILLIKPTIRHEVPLNEFQVDLHSGMFVLRQTDLFISDTPPLSLTRTYRVWDSNRTAFGLGTNHPYDICPTGTRFPYTYMDLNLEDDRPIYFPRISKGTGYADAVFRHDETSSEFYAAQIAWNGDGWTLNFRDGRKLLFPEAYYSKSYAQGAATAMIEADGQRTQLNRDKQRNLERLISPSGHTIVFQYDGENRIIEAKDDTGNLRKYTYDSSGHLTSVADATHVLYRFEYQPLLHFKNYDPYLMTAVIDGSGNVLLSNKYENRGEVSEQKLANGEVYRYEYIYRKDKIVETIVRGPSGERRFFFNHGEFTQEQ